MLWHSTVIVSESSFETNNSDAGGAVYLRYDSMETAMTTTGVTFEERIRNSSGVCRRG